MRSSFFDTGTIIELKGAQKTVRTGGLGQSWGCSSRKNGISSDSSSDVPDIPGSLSESDGGAVGFIREDPGEGAERASPAAFEKRAASERLTGSAFTKEGILIVPGAAGSDEADAFLAGVWFFTLLSCFTGADCPVRP